MRPVPFPGQTVVLGAPKGWDAQKHGPCVGLPIRRGDEQMVSYWRPSLRERLRILFGGFVQLAVAGKGHPPVGLTVAPLPRGEA